MPSVSVAVMGGTFDPIHLGHIDMALKCKEMLNIDKILFIPTGDPPHKQGRSCNKYNRLAMTKLALSDCAWADVLDIEVLREGKTYTFDTLNQLHAMYRDSKIYYIIGADTLGELKSWYRIHDVAKMTDFILVRRMGVREEKLEELKKQAHDDLNLNVIDVCFTGLDISSTEIRSRVCNGKSIDGMVPGLVKEYIFEHGLYR